MDMQKEYSSMVNYLGLCHIKSVCEVNNHVQVREKD